jgi:tetratricopeptide (TPR) repeat protein
MNRAFTGLAVCSVLFFSSCAIFNGSSVRRDIAAEYYAIAEGYAGLSKYENAIPFYRKAALQREYENAADYGLARMLALTGKWQEACIVFSQLYEKDRGNLLVASAYSYSLASNGQIDEALALYESVWNKSIDDPAAIRNYAGILIIAGRFAEALEQIDLLREKFPDTDSAKGLDELEKKVKNGINPPALETQVEGITTVPTTY